MFHSKNYFVFYTLLLTGTTTLCTSSSDKLLRVGIEKSDPIIITQAIAKGPSINTIPLEQPMQRVYTIARLAIAIGILGAYAYDTSRYQWRPHAIDLVVMPFFMFGCDQAFKNLMDFIDSQTVQDFKTKCNVTV